MSYSDNLRDAVAKITALLCGRDNSQKNPISKRARLIRESNIRDAARMVSTMPGVINMGQGLPEFPVPQFLKDAAIQAINGDFNQYSNTWGYPQLRNVIATKMERFNGIKTCAETNVTVTCGASEALNATLLATVDPGQEIIIFEPFYENYHPNALICGAVPRYVKLRAPDWTFDKHELERAFNKRTRAVMLNTPHNPTGRVFAKEELTVIADLCQKWGAIAITDEIYEYMVYDGKRHLSMGSLPGMEDRTITVSGLSKTFGVTGWRLGYVVAPEPYSSALRRVHDYLTLAAPSPLQIAAITALNLPDSYYDQMKNKYQTNRDLVMDAALNAGFRFRKPEGTYYLFTDASALGFENDRKAWEYLLREFNLATVAGYCFFRPDAKTNYIRFCYAKSPQTIESARARLIKVRETISTSSVTS